MGKEKPSAGSSTGLYRVNESSKKAKDNPWTKENWVDNNQKLLKDFPGIDILFFDYLVSGPDNKVPQRDPDSIGLHDKKQAGRVAHELSLCLRQRQDPSRPFIFLSNIYGIYIFDELFSTGYESELFQRRRLTAGIALFSDHHHHSPNSNQEDYSLYQDHSESLVLLIRKLLGMDIPLSWFHKNIDVMGPHRLLSIIEISRLIGDKALPVEGYRGIRKPWIIAGLFEQL